MPHSFLIVSLTLMLLWLASPSSVHADQTMPVVRETVDRADDLVAALIRAKRFDEADSLCQWHQRRSEKTSDSHAKATLRLATIRMAKNIESNRFDEAAVQQSHHPIDELLTQYPGHPRRVFLQAGKQTIALLAVQAQVATAALTVDDETQTLPAMTRLTRLRQQIHELLQAGGRSQTASAEREGQRLEQQLLVASVSMALLQTELFPASSPDAIAAATQAIGAAEQARSRLPRGSPARWEMERMRVEAILRSGDPKFALQEWDRLTKNRLIEQPLIPGHSISGPSVSGRDKALANQLTALKIRIDLELGDSASAESRLYKFYGSTPQSAPSSIPLDLARLQWLLSTKQTELAGDWIEQIEKRGGAYPRRWAEAMAIHHVEQTPDSILSRGLLITRGRRLIQRGETLKGGTLLAQAAKHENDPQRAIAISLAAAAALQESGQTADAGELLRTIASQHSPHPPASGVHLQAMILLAQPPVAVTSDDLEAMLRFHLKTWPESESALSARTWLIRSLDLTDRNAEAAMVATQLPASQVNKSSMDLAVDRWIIAFKSTDPGQREERMPMSRRSMVERSFSSLNDLPHAASAHRQIAALFFARPHLESLPDPPPAEPDWITAVIEIRQNGGKTDELSSVPENRCPLVRQRLLTDGESNAMLRRQIADLLQSWRQPQVPLSLDRVTLQLWQGNVEAALATAQDWVAANPDTEDLLRAATLLSQSKCPQAMEASLALWDQLAAGSPRNGPLWHRAKLAAIELLHRSGQKEQAAQRARYIMLTLPQLEPVLQSKYEQYPP